jgi:hypothetical protein
MPALLNVPPKMAVVVSTIGSRLVMVILFATASSDSDRSTLSRISYEHVMVFCSQVLV